MKWKDKIAEVMRAHPKGKRLNADGSELPDPTPMDPPIGYKPAPSMFEVMREMIREEKLKAALEAEGLETPDEADDFDVDDDYEPSSPYEHNFDHVADPNELKRLRASIDLRERELRGESRAPSSSPPDNISGGRGGGAGATGSPDSEAPRRSEDPARGPKVM